MTLSHQDQLEAVREAVIKANPEACLDFEHCRTHLPTGEVRGFNRPLRLADVLLALGKIAVLPDDFMVLSTGRIVADNRKVSRVWNLRSDSLDEQPPETIAFLHSLLVS